MASTELIKSRLCAKYGTCMLVDLERLKTNPFCTLRSISSKYNISYQSLQQKFQRLHGSYTEYVARKQEDFVCNVDYPLDTVSMLEIRLRGLQNPILRKLVAEGAFLRMCCDKGIEYRLFYIDNRRFIVIGRYVISVTYTSTLRKVGNSKAAKKYYRIEFPRKIIDVSNLLVAYSLEYDEFIFALPEDFGRGKMLQVPYVADSTKQRRKRALHIDRWGILE